MAANEPITEVDAGFSAPGAPATPWAEGRELMEDAELYWLSTVRPDGRPHVTPLIGVWLDGGLHFCTGPGERKAKNLARNPNCIVTTGRNALAEGLDVVVEGEAVRVTDDATLQRLADAWVSKYGDDWRFSVKDGVFVHDAGQALVFQVAPAKAFGFRKGEYAQTRWRFYI